MPKKCCTHFNNEPCTSNYDSNLDSISVFRFPRNPIERNIWINSLPSKIKVKDNSVLCEKHWPTDIPRKRCQGPLVYRPINAPSEFGSYCNQQFLLKEKSMIEMYRLSRERSERKEKINNVLTSVPGMI